MSKPRAHANKPRRNTPAKKPAPKRQAAYRQAARLFPLPFSLRFFTLNSKSLSLLLLLCAVAAFGIWLLQPQQLSLRQVDIEVLDANARATSLQHLAMSDVQQSLKGLVQGNLLWLDLDKIQQRIMQLAWVKSAQVRRRWPTTLHVQLQEQQAVAYWQTLEAQAVRGLLNPQGELFLSTPQNIPETLALPRLHGISGSHKQVWNTYQSLLASLQGTGLSIQSLQFDAQQNWRVWLGQQQAHEKTAWLQVSLGRMPIMPRWLRFLDMYQTHLRQQAEQIHAVDLRYEQGIAVAY